MEISSHLDITGQKILLVGFWWEQNMGDELILIGNIKLLQQQGKQIFVVSQHNDLLKQFISQEVDCSNITFLDEIPRGFRSTIKYLKKNGLQQLKTFFQIDTIILWGWEILTEESPHSYYYRFRSIRPALFLRKKLYLMGGIQIPKKWWNKLLFKRLLSRAIKIFSRDFESIVCFQEYGYKNVEFFMDTSYFVKENWKKYKHKSDQQYIVVNLNSKGERFFDDLVQSCKDYLKTTNGIIYFVPVFAWKGDADIRYFEKLKQQLNTDRLKVLPRIENFEDFLQILWWAEKVIAARLHLFLISSFIGLTTEVFPYQKKINKMKAVIKQLQS